MTRTIGKVGFWSGLAAFTAVVGYDLAQFLQEAGVLSFPADAIAIYAASLCITIPFVLEILALHYLTPPDRRFWTHAALVFTTIYAVFVIANYVVQLATVIPSAVAGQLDAIRVLDQTPHSLFWNYDAIGYIAMGLAAGFALPAIGKTGFERWVRISLIIHVLTTPLIAVVYFYPTFSTRLLFVGAPWAITAPVFMLMLALLLRTRAAEGRAVPSAEGRGVP